MNSGPSRLRALVEPFVPVTSDTLRAPGLLPAGGLAVKRHNSALVRARLRERRSMFRKLTSEPYRSANQTTNGRSAIENRMLDRTDRRACISGSLACERTPAQTSKVELKLQENAA